MAYLDETGLSHLWGKITSAISSNSSSGGGTCTPPFPADAVVCYDNTSGTNGTFTLSDSTPNYHRYVAIQLKNQAWIVSCISNSLNSRYHWFARFYSSGNSTCRSLNSESPYSSNTTGYEGMRHMLYIDTTTKRVSQSLSAMHIYGSTSNTYSPSDAYIYDPYKIIKVVIWN